MVLVCCVFIFVAAFLICGKSKNGGTTVTVKEANQVVFKGSVFEENSVILDGNIISIKNGTVFMKEADCKHQICVKHKKIENAGESIICLPNRVVVTIS